MGEDFDSWWGKGSSIVVKGAMDMGVGRQLWAEVGWAH